MATVQHPLFETITYEVPEADVPAWVEQGWTRVDAPEFDEGEGFLPGGLTEIVNDTGVPEPVKPPKPGPRTKP